MQGNEIQFLSWADLERDCKLLASRISVICSRGQQPTNAGLLCVARGGMVITRLVHGYLKAMGHDLPIGFIQAQSYTDDDERGEISVSDIYWPLLSSDEPPELIFVIDDIADTGNTLKAIKDALTELYGAGGIIPAVLYYKCRSVIQPPIYIHMTEDASWIRFPFETEDIV